MKNIIIKSIFLFISSFTLLESAPIADAGEDFNACRVCWDENSSIYDGTYKILLNGDGSYDSDNLELSYSWEKPDNFLITDSTLSSPKIRFDYANNSINDLDISLDYEFILTVSNGISEDSDTVSIVFEMSAPIIPTVYSKSDSGKVVLTWTSESENSVDSLTGYRDFEGYRIYKSIDGGDTWGDADGRIYYNGDYKGWRPYVQFDLLDSADVYYCIFEEDCDIVIPENVRQEDIFGVDPMAPWVSLGDNSGLQYSYIDTNVYNGLEYTYAVVSYDMGLRTFVDDYDQQGNSGVCTDSNGDFWTEDDTDEIAEWGNKKCCDNNDGTWDSDLTTCSYTVEDGLSNWQPIYAHDRTQADSDPKKFSFQIGGGYISLESPIIDCAQYDDEGECNEYCPGRWIDDCMDIDDEMVCNMESGCEWDMNMCMESGDGEGKCLEQNMVTVISGFYAENIENISYSGVESAEGIILSKEPQNIGNGGAYFVIVNEDDLSENSYRFEINADIPLDAVNSTINVMGTDFDKGFKTGNPSLYIYEININDTSAIDYDPGHTIAELSESAVEDFLSLPGAYSTDTDIYVPKYLLEDFPIKYLDEPGASTNFTDFFDGIKFRFDNSIKYLYSNDYKAVVNRLLHITTNENTGARDTTDISESNAFNIGLEYGNEGDSFDLRPPYSYKLTLSTMPSYEVGGVENRLGNTLLGDAYVDPCFDDVNGNGALDAGEPNRPNTMLPFEITNLTTNKKIGLIHTDTGKNYRDLTDDCEQTCSATQICSNGVCQDLIGLNDCTWQRNEAISFTSDTVYTLNDMEMIEAFTYVLNFDLPRLLASIPSSPYDSTKSNYGVGDVVRYTQMLWEATSAVSEGLFPTVWIDNDYDDINDNPWIPIYPWEEGDEIIIEPVRWYVDGDAWVANFSEIGKEVGIQSDDLDEISVVPNPYLVHSDFNESNDSRLMWFTHLPTYCYISIYTVSGELVTTFDHNDDFSGQEPWNLRSGNDLNCGVCGGNAEVAPGLYIFTVESGNGSSYDEFKHIGKFAIVR